jgi:hypothetical protein
VRTETDGADRNEKDGQGDEEGTSRARESVPRTLEGLETSKDETRHGGSG